MPLPMSRSSKKVLRMQTQLSRVQNPKLNLSSKLDFDFDFVMSVGVVKTHSSPLLRKKDILDSNVSIVSPKFQPDDNYLKDLYKHSKDLALFMSDYLNDKSSLQDYLDCLEERLKKEEFQKLKNNFHQEFLQTFKELAEKNVECSIYSLINFTRFLFSPHLQNNFEVGLSSKLITISTKIEIESDLNICLIFEENGRVAYYKSKKENKEKVYEFNGYGDFDISNGFYFEKIFS